MNNKGFTLVEMLAVVTIIGLLALLTIPAIDSIIKSNKESVYEIQEKQMIDALKEYAADNALSLGDETRVTLLQLKKGGYIDKEVKNPKTNECFKNSIVLTITRSGNHLNYEIDRSTIAFCPSTNDTCEC